MRDFCFAFLSQNFKFNIEHYLQGNREQKGHAYSAVNLEGGIIQSGIELDLSSVADMITFRSDQISRSVVSDSL